MANLKNHTLKLDYPIYTAKFLNNKTLLVAGGGGEGNNGIPNKMTVIAVQPENIKKPLKRYRELVLNEKEDSVMSLDASNGIILAGINENSSMMRKGVNKHLRKFKFVNDHLKFVQSCQIHPNTNSTMYQKITAVSSDGSTGVVVMSDNPSTVYIVDSFDDLEEKFKIMTDGDVKDVSISPDGKLMSYITTNTFEAISMVTGRSVFKDSITFSMSRVRFINNDEVIISGSKDANAIVAKFSIAKSKIVQQNMICKNLKGTTSMDVNVNNDLIAVTTSDYSILIVNISELKLIKKLNNVHKFAITKVVFSDDGKYLASGSAANTVNVIEIPAGLSKSRSTLSSIFHRLVTLLFIALFAVVIQYLYQENYINMAYDKALEIYNSYKPHDSSNYFVVEEVDSNLFSSTSFEHTFCEADATIHNDIISSSGEVTRTKVEKSDIYNSTTSDLPSLSATSEEEVIKATTSIINKEKPVETEKSLIAETISISKLSSSKSTVNETISSTEFKSIKASNVVDLSKTQASLGESTSLSSELLLTPLTTKPIEITKEIIKEVTKEVTATKEVFSTVSLVETKVEISTAVHVVTKVETKVLEVTVSPSSLISFSVQPETVNIYDTSVAAPAVVHKNGTDEGTVEQAATISVSQMDGVESNGSHSTVTLQIEPESSVYLDENEAKSAANQAAIEVLEGEQKLSIQIEPSSQVFSNANEASLVADNEALKVIAQSESANSQSTNQLSSTNIQADSTTSVSQSSIEKEPSLSIQIEPEIQTFSDGKEAQEAIKDQLEYQLDQN